MWACNFIKKRPQRKCFPMKYEKFLRAVFLQNHLRWLLLKILFLFYVKIYFRIKKKRIQKLITLLMNQVIFPFKMKKYASFVEMSMIHITISKAQLLSFVTQWKILLLLKHLLFLINIFCLPCVCFFDFLIPLTTEATCNSCL